MRRVKIALLLILPLAWILYWVGAAQFSERYAGPRLDGALIEGAAISHGGLSMAGFPHRFELSVARPRLLDARRGMGWSAPSMRLEAASYRPQDVTLRLPDTQQLHLPGETLAVTSTRLDAGMRVRPLARLGLDALRLDATGLRIESPQGWRAGLGAATLRMDRADRTGRRHDLTIDATDLVPPTGLAGGAIPARIDGARLDAQLEFTRPIDRDAADALPPLAALVLRESMVGWGRVEIRAQGTLDFDAAGRPEGRLTLRLTHWRDLLDLVEAADLLGGTELALAERALQSLEDRGDVADQVEVPLTLSDGMIRLGALPLAPIPRLSP